MIVLEGVRYNSADSQESFEGGPGGMWDTFCGIRVFLYDWDV